MNSSIQMASPAAVAHGDLSEKHLATSAVSWSAILAGAAGAAALSLILLILGTGLGLSSISPWVHEGVSATTLGVSTILWITLTQLAASGMGGYLAGRLRTRWLSAPTDEVYFRDTAHGFLAWAIASLVTAAVLTSAIGSIVGSGVQASASLAGGMTSAAASSVNAAATAAESMTERSPTQNEDTASYFINTLLRRAPASTASVNESTSEVAEATPIQPELPTGTTDEINGIFMNSIWAGDLPADDVSYTAQLVSAHTGLSTQQAEARVKTIYRNLQTKFKEAEAATKAAADKARKASAYTALWLFISLLSGAFFSSWMATFGGRLRDA